MCRINRRGPVFGDSVKYSSIVISKNETERNSTSGKEVTDRSVTSQCTMSQKPTSC